MGMTQAQRYQKWYSKNKEALAARRKKRYAEDPDYKARQLANKQAQTQKLRATRQPLPEQYKYNLTQLAEQLELSSWTLRDWMQKGYFPAPFTRSRVLYFTETQAFLVGKLKEWLAAHNSARNKDKLEEVTDYIHANWE